MNKDLQRFRQVVSCLSPPIKSALSACEAQLSHKAREIRLMLNRPVTIICNDGRYYITSSGSVTPFFSDSLLMVQRNDIESTLQSICEYSVYSRQNEIVNGFVTLKGGHRAGISGTAVLSDGKITNIRDISSLNLRIAREYIGCADRLFRRFGNNKTGMLICGEPCSGKTTVLRDLARQLSTLTEYNVSLIDERGELAASVSGAPQNDIGMCDVYSGYPKAEAMIQAIRSMSPDIIMCDEIGSQEEVLAVEQCVNSGVSIIATIHAGSVDELKRRTNLCRLLDTGAFQKIVFLSDRRHIGEAESVMSTGDLLAS